MPAPQVTVLSEDTDREQLVAALLQVNGEAKRCLRRDNLGRENPRWETLHAFMNTLLDWLVD